MAKTSSTLSLRPVFLFFVFWINGFCLFRFFSHRRFVTDFIEPENLFSITMNSMALAEGDQRGGKNVDEMIDLLT